MYFCFDTETTGLPTVKGAPYRHSSAYSSCRILTIAWYLLDEDFRKMEKHYFVIRPEFEPSCCCQSAEGIHGISYDFALENGTPFDVMLPSLLHALNRSSFIVGHNVSFDIHALKHELWRREKHGILDALRDKKVFCTMKFACMKFGWHKYPKLVDLHQFLFEENFENVHHALSDVRACVKCFMALTQHT